MKRALLCVVLALAMTFAFAAGAFATTGKFFAHSTSYYSWNKPAIIPPGTASPAGLFNIGDNPANPGAHANYLATTAKCGMCHSVHRAAADGVKLLPTDDASCAGCHTGSTAITAKIITVAPVNTNWVPDGSAGPAGGGGGPHNDSAADLVADGYWDGTGSTPQPSYAHGERYGCFTRRCHATNPHGAGGSKYKLFAAKLLFNDSPADDELNFATADHPAPFSYGGLDAAYDDLGATDAAVERFIDANPTVLREDPAAAGVLQVSHDAGTTWAAPNAAETHALVSGLTCGRPSTGDTGGYDECHAEAVYAVIDKRVKEQRNHATGITSGSAYRTDNTGEEALGYGGNDNRDWKTGHVAGLFPAVNANASYAGISGCTSCHDQTDKANTVEGNFTFPHGQTPTGVTNLVQADGVTSATGLRARLWSGYGGNVGAPLVYTAGTNQKAYDGQCLKCHRDGAGNGIGLTK